MDKKELSQLLSDDSQRLKPLYDTYRTPFMNLGRQYGLGDEVLAQVYQEAFITMYKRGIKGKLHKVSNSMHEYLLGVGKFMIYDTLKTRLPIIPAEDALKNANLATVSRSSQQYIIDLVFKKSEPECQNLLKLFYYRGLSHKEIAVLSEFEDAQAVIAKKNLCLQSFKPTIQLSTDVNRQLFIQKHLKNRLTENEQTDFDRLLKTDPNFKREVTFLEDVYKIMMEEAEIQLRELLAEFETEYQPYKKSSRALWYVAACILVLLGMAYFFTIMQPASAENLYADYFKPYKNVVHPVIEGVQVLDQKTKAFSTYEKRDYNEAINRFKALYKQTGDSYYLFYQANAHMANNQVEEAILLLRQHLQVNDALKKKTLWYLAIAYLKLQKEAEAKSLLKQIVKEKSYNFKKAKEILKTLE